MTSAFPAASFGAGSPTAISPLWRFDAVGRHLHGPGGSRHLTPREAAVLACLVEAGSGSPVSRKVLLDRVWADSEVGDEALSVVISRLRNHLRRAGVGGAVIRTVPKTGYMLIDDISSAAPTRGDRRTGQDLRERRLAGLAMVLACAALILALALSLAHLFSGTGLHAAPDTNDKPLPSAPPESAPEVDPGKRSWRH